MVCGVWCGVVMVRVVVWVWVRGGTILFSMFDDTVVSIDTIVSCVVTDVSDWWSADSSVDCLCSTDCVV